MGQVPGRAALLLIGDGRLAGHLSSYFRSEHFDLVQWSRRSGIVGAASSDVPKSLGDPLEILPRLIDEADRVLLGVSDDALPGFVRTHRRDPRQTWVHFSGSVLVDGAWTAHPLCTFSGAPYEREVYETIPFILEREGPTLDELIPGLANPSATIPRAAKPLYHALCVTAGNFTQLLWQQLFNAFEDRLGLSAELAMPYLRQTARGLEHSGAEALTGPIVRRDHGTIGDNIEALRDAGMDDLAEVYEAFVRLGVAA